jgi:hypothetical protein
MSGARRIISCCVVATLAALLPTVAMAQATTGELAGRISDPGGAVVPGVTVVAENLARGVSRTAVTNEAGEYIITLLRPGRYTVTAELSGFRRIVHEDVEVSVGTRHTLNLALEVGNLTESVVVSGVPPLIETTTSDLGGVVTPREIENLPLLNRTFAGLAVIMPEARPVGNFDPTKARMGSVAMSGGDGRQLDVNVDGGDNKDNVVGSLLQNFAYESIQEFQVLQHRWTAESGRAVGGVVNVITKSGTNSMRGSLFGNGRSQDTRARDFFEKQLAGDKADFSRQEFGGSIGGPIRRDNLFYFGALERFRERQQTPVRAAAVPQLQAIPGADPVTAIPQPYDDTLFSVKVDQRINDRQTMFYRYSQQNNASPNDQVSSPATTDLTGGNTTTNDLYSFVANHSWTIGPTKLNQFSFHFQDFTNEKLSVTDRPNLVFPTVQTGANVNVPQATYERKFQMRNDFTWQGGAHGVKAGVNYINTDMSGFFYFGARGYRVHFFDDPVAITTNSALYPQGFATPGAVRLIEQTDGEGDFELPAHQLALYVQDDWRVGRNLTLNLGLRWDANMGFLPDQTDNRTIRILQQLNDPAGAGDRRRPGSAAAPHALVDRDPAAARLRLRPRRRGPHRRARRLRDLLRPGVPEPDAVLDPADAAHDLPAGADAHEHERRRRPDPGVPVRRRPAAAGAGRHEPDRPGVRRVRPHQRPRHDRPAGAEVLDRRPARRRAQLERLERLRAHARQRRAARARDQPVHPQRV